MAKQTLVVNLRYKQYEVLIARPSIWGNPFKIGEDGTREQVIEKYEAYIRKKPKLLTQLSKLRGKILGCWCKPEPCHGDVLVKLLEEFTKK